MKAGLRTGDDERTVEGPRRRLLTDRAIRTAALVPVVVLAVTAVVTGDVGRPGLLLGVVAVISLLALGALTAPRSTTAAGERPPMAPVIVGALAVLFAVLVFTLRFDGDPRRYTLVFGVIMVAGAFALPRVHRGPLIVWAGVGWLLSLAFGGVRDVTDFLTQMGGALLLSLVALRTTASLETALRIERTASRASRTRASLLGSVLRLQSLEPAAVADAVVRGAREAGFDSAVLRVVDGPELRLIAARPAGGHDPELWLPADVGIGSVVRRTGRAVVLDDYQEHPAAISAFDGLRGTVVVPVRVDGEVAAVLFASRRSRGVRSVQVQAIELLAEEAGAALQRARRFAADTATVVELRRLDERTHDFVSTVSHELRTPMTVITGLGQTLERRWDDLSPGRRADLLRRIDENAERLAVMVRSLVDTSALERGQLVIRPSTVELAPCVANILGRLAPLLDEHDTEVAIAADLQVQADPALLEHVVENLLSNAARHTPPGTQVRIAAARVGDDVEVEVVDEGPGIPTADLPHVLERFYRAGEPTTRPSGGLGLGLALSQQVLLAHGRELTVSSEEGRGTRFAFRLPAADEDSPVSLP